jgi:hypothetical protein
MWVGRIMSVLAELRVFPAVAAGSHAAAMTFDRLAGIVSGKTLRETSL